MDNKSRDIQKILNEFRFFVCSSDRVKEGRKGRQPVENGRK